MARSSPIRPLEDPSGPSTSEQWRLFSLWNPTALHPVLRWLHLTDDGLGLVTRRAFVVTAVAWLPLFIMSAIAGRLSRGATVPFLLDLDLQSRLLVALPLLIIGEIIVHRRMPIVVRQFVERGIVSEAARADFDRAVASALRLSRSPYSEILLVVCLYTVGVSLHASIASLPGSTWYGTPLDGSMDLTPAGWWNIAVSRPLFQFELLRWYYRFFIWNRFVWEVSRLHLRLVPTHPDRRAGLGFVFSLNDAFGPFLFANGTMLAGTVANGLVHAGLTFQDYAPELLAVPAAALLCVLAPDLIFALLLLRVRRKGLADYGRLSQRYVREFDHKWVHQSTPVSERLLGNPDIQSLADLANSFDTIREIRVLPTRDTLIALLVITLLPLAPLPLLGISSAELLERLVKVLL